MKKIKILAMILAILLILPLCPLDLSAAAEWNGTTWNVEYVNGAFKVTRSGDVSQEVTVTVRTVSLSALEGVHFEPMNRTLTLPAGITSQTFTVTERAVDSITTANALYKYQNADRSYRFEVLDEYGFVLADCTKNLGYANSGIGSSTYGEKTVTVTTDTIKVTDGGFTQAYHAVPIDSYFSAAAPQEYLYYSGATLEALVTFKAGEEEDGYQYIQILANNTQTCDGNGSGGKPATVSKSLYMAGFEHKEGSLMENFYSYGFPVTDVADNEGKDLAWKNTAYNNNPIGNLVRQNFKSGCRSTNGKLIIPTNLSTLGIRFDASGSNQDDWFVEEFKVKIQATPRAPQASTVYVSYGRNAKHNRVTVAVPFSEIVNVTDTPTLTTTWGTLSYVTGSGTNVLAFEGEITASENTQLKVTGLSGTVKGVTGTSFSWSGTQTVAARVGSTRSPQSVNGAMQIASISDLLYFADRLGSYPQTSAVLTADLDLSPILGFTAMGGTSGYAGTFDGAGHTIKGLTKANAANGYGGFFAKIAQAGTVRNLNFEDVSLEYTSLVTCGIICGQNNGTIEKCTVSGTLRPRDTLDASGKSVGAICGVNTGTVKDCAAVNTDSTYIINIYKWNNLTVGGVVGSNSGTVEGCLFYARYGISTQTNITRGAVVGSNSGTVRNCVGLHHNNNYFNGSVGANTGTVENVTFPEAGDAFTKGEVCYTLCGGVIDGTQSWGQKIDGSGTKDPLPVLGGPTVYTYKNGTAYSNIRYYTYTLNVEGKGPRDTVTAKAQPETLFSQIPGEAPAGTQIKLLIETWSTIAIRSITVSSGADVIYSKTNDLDVIEMSLETTFSMPAGDVTIDVVLLPVYSACFLNYDESTIITYQQHMQGGVPVYGGSTPTRPADAQYTYYFDGWDDGTTLYAPGAALPALTSSVTYTAHYTNTINYYDVTFKNYDGTLLQSDNLPYGATPVYTGNTPSKPANGNITYVFDGWDQEISPVTGETVYTATYYQNETGTIGGISFTVEGNTLTLTGSGAFTLENPLDPYPWAGYASRITDLVIGEGITGIGQSAFANFTSLENVSLPRSLAAVGQLAFTNCGAITSALYAGSSAEWEAHVAVEEGNDDLTSALTCVLYSIRSASSGHGALDAPLGAGYGDTVTFTATPDADYSVGSVHLYYALPGGGTGSITPTRNGNTFSFTMPEADVDVYVSFVIDMSGTLYGLNWTLYDGVLSFAGSGVVDSSSNYPYSAHKNEITAIELGDGVTMLLEYAFMNFAHLKNVSFGANSALTVIERYAFYNCLELESIELPASLEDIQSNAFYSCHALETLTFAEGSSLEFICSAAFIYCDALTSVSIPASVTTISDYAFRGCTALTNLTFAQDGALTTLGTGAFYGCSSLGTVSIPASVTTIGTSLFNGCTSLVMADFDQGSPITAIPASTFYHCDALETVSLPAHLSSIGKSAFGYCENLSTMVFHGSQEQWLHVNIDLGNEVLNNLTISYVFGQRSIRTAAGLEDLAYIANLPYGAPTGGVVSFGVQAQTGWALDEVYITYTENGQSVQTVLPIENGSCSFTMPDADVTVYADCYRSDSGAWGNITWTLDHTALTLTGSGAMALPVEQEIYPWYAYRTEITDVTVSSGITSIAADAFAHYPQFHTVTLPDTLTSIGAGAFARSPITSIDLPLSLTGVGEAAFSGCSALAVVTYAGSAAQWDAYVTVGENNDPLDPDAILYAKHSVYTSKHGAGTIETSTLGANAGDTVTVTITPAEGYALDRGTVLGASLEIPQFSSTFTFTMPDHDVDVYGSFVRSVSGTWDNLSWSLYDGALTISGNGLMLFAPEYPWDAYIDVIITSLTVESGVTSIASGAFDYYNGLTSVDLPAGVLYIDNSAFRHCSALTSLTLGAGLQIIGNEAFAYCSALEAVDLPAGVTEIETEAFYGCTSLNTLVLRAGLQTIGDYAFGAIGEAAVVIPEGVTTIGECAFCNSYITSLSLPLSLESIGELAFAINGDLSTVSVSYAGSKAQWARIEIDFGNASLLDPARMHFALRSVWGYESEQGSVVPSTYGARPGDTITLTALPAEGYALGRIYAFGYLVPENGVYSFTMPDADVTVTASFCRYATGTWGDNITWTLDRDALTLTGSGAMREPEQNETYPWECYANEIKTLNIGGGITTISYRAFIDTRYLETVNFPADSALVSVGEHAFANAGSSVEGANGLVFRVGNELQTLPAGVQTIGVHAFRASGVKALALPASLETIGDYAFMSSALTEIVIPEGVTSVGMQAFQQCHALTNAVFEGSTIARIGLAAFEGCELLSTIVLPEGLTELEFRVLSGCSSLTSVSLPSGLTSIGDGAFHDDDALETVTIPAGVTSIGQFAFIRCASLADVYFGGSEAQWTQVTIGTDNDPLLAATMHYALRSIYTQVDAVYGTVIPDKIAVAPGQPVTLTLTPAYGWAFDTVYVNGVALAPTNGVYSFTMPDADVTITADFTAHTGGTWGTLTWELEHGVLTLTGSGDMPETDIENNYPWYPGKGEITSVVIEDGITSVSDKAFYAYSLLHSVTLPAGLRSIGIYAFSETALTTLTLPEGVESVGQHAFDECYSLTTVYLPLSLTAVTEYAFDDCDSLSDVYYAGSYKQWLEIAIDYYNAKLTYANIRYALLSIWLHAGDHCSVTASPAGAAAGQTVTLTVTTDPYYRVSSVSINYETELLPENGVYTFVMPDQDVSVYASSELHAEGTWKDNITWTYSGSDSYATLEISGSGAIAEPEDGENYPWKDFQGNVSSLIIGKDITAIGNSCFAQFISMDYVEFEEGSALESIGYQAFASAVELYEAYLPEGVRSLGNGAFVAARSLTNVGLPEGLVSIGDEAFLSCEALESVTIPASVTTIGDRAFLNCFELREVIFEKNSRLATLGELAFYCCRNLPSIALPDTLTAIERVTFYACEKLEYIYIPAGITGIPESVFNVCNSLADVYFAGSETEWNAITVAGGNDPLLAATVHFGMHRIVVSCADWDQPKVSYAPVGELFTLTPDEGFAYENVTVNGSPIVPDGNGVYSFTVPDSSVYVELETYINASGTWKDNITWSLVRDTLTVTGTGAIAEQGEDEDYPWSDYLYGFYIQKLTVGKNVTVIAPIAFGGLINLETVTFEEGSVLTTIGAAAFVYAGHEAEGLTLVGFPATVTTVGDAAFLGSSLLSIDLPEGLETIGDSAFYGSKLTSVTIPASVLSIGNGAFFIETLESVTIEARTTPLALANQAFDGSPALRTVTIGEGLTEISDYCFRGDTALETVYLPASLVSIGGHAFDNCTALADVYFAGSEAEWNAITVGEYNDALLFATVHFNSPAPTEDPYDLDGDGNINISDVTLLLNVLAGGNEDGVNCDVDRDGFVNISDVTALLNYLAGN